MYCRRVFASAAIPTTMWRSLHIQSARQANRKMPSMVPIVVPSMSSMASCSSVGLAATGMLGICEGTSMTSSVLSDDMLVQMGTTMATPMAALARCQSDVVLRIFATTLHVCFIERMRTLSVSQWLLL